MVIRLKQESGTLGVHALHVWCAGFFCLEYAFPVLSNA